MKPEFELLFKDLIKEVENQAGNVVDNMMISDAERYLQQLDGKIKSYKRRFKEILEKEKK